MEFKNVIYGRRSVRKYSSRKIEPAILEEIIDAGLWAPSGVNLQPWYFVVINSNEAMNEFTKMMSDVAKKNTAHLEERFGDNPEVIQSTLKFISSLGNAPVVILAFRDKPDYSYALQDEGVVQSIAAAMENIILSAYDHGLYSCWLTAPVQAGMEEIFREKFATGHGNLVCIATLGYPEDDEIPKAPKRKENKYIIL